jgi:hypothetical protein
MRYRETPQPLVFRNGSVDKYIEAGIFVQKAFSVRNAVGTPLAKLLVQFVRSQEGGLYYALLLLELS